jgi:hypothetical protein
VSSLHSLTSRSSTVLRLKCACVSASDVSSCSASDRTARTNGVTADFEDFFPFFSVALSGDEGPISWDRWRLRDFKNAWHCMGWRILGTGREEQSDGIENRVVRNAGRNRREVKCRQGGGHKSDTEERLRKTTRNRPEKDQKVP